jgi:hypothetical protein
MRVCSHGGGTAFAILGEGAIRFKADSETDAR